MSYIICPDCLRKIRIFESENMEDFYREMELDLLGELPMTREIVDISKNGIRELGKDIEDTLTSIVDRIVKVL